MKYDSPSQQVAKPDAAGVWLRADTRDSREIIISLRFLEPLEPRGPLLEPPALRSLELGAPPLFVRRPRQRRAQLIVQCVDPDFGLIALRLGVVEQRLQNAQFPPNQRRLFGQRLNLATAGRGFALLRCKLLLGDRQQSLPFLGRCHLVACLALSGQPGGQRGAQFLLQGRPLISYDAKLFRLLAQRGELGRQPLALARLVTDGISQDLQLCVGCRQICLHLLVVTVIGVARHLDGIQRGAKVCRLTGALGPCHKGRA
jgi:hypothetical protein